MNVQAGREAREFRSCQIGIRPPSYGLEICQCSSRASRQIFPFTPLKIQMAAADAQTLIRHRPLSSALKCTVFFTLMLFHMSRLYRTFPEHYSQPALFSSISTRLVFQWDPSSEQSKVRTSYSFNYKYNSVLVCIHQHHPAAASHDAGCCSHHVHHKMLFTSVATVGSFPFPSLWPNHIYGCRRSLSRCECRYDIFVSFKKPKNTGCRQQMGVWCHEL